MENERCIDERNLTQSFDMGNVYSKESLTTLIPHYVAMLRIR